MCVADDLSSVNEGAIREEKRRERGGEVWILSWEKTVVERVIKEGSKRENPHAFLSSDGAVLCLLQF